MTSVTSPNVQIIAMPLPFSGSASGCARIGTRAPNSGVITRCPNSGWYRSSSGCATSATQAGISSGRVVSISIVAASRPKRDAVIGARPFPILELGLRDRRPEVHVPQRRRLELIREAAIEQAEKRELRHALRRAADRRVRHRPVDRQAEVAPQRSNAFSSSTVSLAQSSMKFGRDTAIGGFGGVSGGGVNDGSYGSDGSQRTPK